MPALFAFLPGGMDMLILLFVVLLLFGNRLPSVMRSLGQGVTEFKKGVAGIEEDRDEHRPNDPGRKIDDNRKTPEERPA
ncbi:MAG TPA: twin-arginine translocase TatA/TatE family subunit [Pirellulales bacterium]|jgi:sec-independent protein translocase protein TatA|nr:twin-arginine translocase TatA/TatE family subunit [Pirellulales bacterium]